MSILFQYQKKLFWFRNGITRNFFLHHFIHRPFSPFSTLITQDPPAKNPSFMADYLVISCGFSKEKAMVLSKSLAHLNDPKKPDSVLSFLKDRGFHDTHIRHLIKTRPAFLCADVDKYLKPKIMVFQDLGMSDSEIVKLVTGNPNVLARSVEKHLLPWIHFLRTLLLTDGNIIKVINRDYRFLSYKHDKSLVPNVSFLQKCGVSDERIGKLIINSPRIIAGYPVRFKVVVERVGKFGIDYQSKMFVYGVAVLGQMSESTLVGKFKVLKSFGWSEIDVSAAFRRCPSHVTCTESKLREKMEFFVNELKVEPSFIALRPELLTYSVEKRIIPRHNVLRILKSKELLNRDYNVYSIVTMSEKKFLEVFVLPHKDKAVDVCEAYIGNVGMEFPSMRC